MAEGGEASDKGKVIPTVSISDLPLDEILLKKLEASKELKILIVGCYQVGKSTLINSLLFKQGEKYKKKAKEGLLSPCTKDVKPFPLKIHGTQVYIYDSPGLQDENTKNDLKYLKLIEEACPNIHLIIYCKKMGDPMRPAEKEALQSLNTAFGSSIWDNTIIALTFANKIDPSSPDTDVVEYFEEVRQKNVEEIEKAFEKFIGNKKIVEKLKTRVYPVGSVKDLNLPGMADGEDWRGYFWKGCIEACNEEAMGAVLRLALHDPAFIAMFMAEDPKKSLIEKIFDFIKRHLGF